MRSEPKARGHLKVYAVNVATGGRTLVVDDHNVITNLQLTSLAELVAQKSGFDPAENAFHSMWIEGSDTALAAESATDTQAAGVVVKKHVFDRASDVDVDVGGTPGLLQFRATLGSGEGNGSTIRAAGIYTRGDNDDPDIAAGVKLVARKVFADQAKTSGIELQFEWDVQYSGA